MLDLRNKKLAIILAIVVILGFILLYPKLFATQKVKLYFSNQQAQYLVVEDREVKLNKLYQNVIQELIKGPQNDNLVETISEGVKLLDLEVEEGIAKVDFSQELVTNHPGGTAGELMTVYSVVNTLTQLEDINQVQILVAGQEVDTLVGHLNLKQPLEFKNNLVE
ncbi:GerMN domain-containing protein [Halanaerobaculum tunisiense]